MCERAVRPEFSSETKLLALAQGGDDAAITHLLTKHEPLQRLIRSLSAKVDPYGTAREDLESAARLEVLQALERYKPQRGARFTTYIFKRLRGAMIETLRASIGGGTGSKSQAEPVRPISAEADGPDGSAPSWEEDLANRDPDFGRDPAFKELERAEQAELVRVTVRGLPTGQRQVTEAVFWGGTEHQEIAAERGVSRPAVTRMLGRALTAVGRELDPVRIELVA